MIQSETMKHVEGMLGRATIVANQFEDHVKSVTSLLKLRRNMSIMGTDAQIADLYRSIHKKSLATCLKSWKCGAQDLYQVLCAAREARNTIVHEAPKRIRLAGLHEVEDQWPQLITDYFFFKTQIIVQGIIVMCLYEIELRDTPVFIPPDDYENILPNWVINRGPLEHEIKEIPEYDD